MKEYTLGEKVFVIEDITLWQMELISDLLSDARKKIFEAAINVDMRAATEKIIVNVAEMFQQLRAEKKLSRIISYMLVEKGKKFTEDEANNNYELIRLLPYEQAEEIFGFFFHSGMLQKIIMPTFLIPEQQPLKSEKM